MTFEVIIPHYSRAPRLRRTLDALRCQTEPVAVCVVDNASVDDSVAVVATDYPEVRLVALATNLGFGGACNAAIGSSRAEYVVLLNNDAVPDADFVAELQRGHEQAGSPDMLSPCLLQPGGLVDSYGIQLDASFNMFDSARGRPYQALAGDDAPQAFAPTGGAGVYSRDRVLAVGGFDPEIFAYLEDVDLGLRLWLSGSRWAGAVRAKATHEHSATLGSGSRRKNYLLARSKLYLLRKYRLLLQPRTLVQGVLTEAVVSVGKGVVDRNLGSLRGWCDGASTPVQPIRGARGSLDELLQPRGLVDGIRVRRASRTLIAAGAES
jgi:N-acetylglucosaminyl-diphospho-decaprenol L-rhamnosyltransferase